jgi:hypothetical protein
MAELQPSRTLPDVDRAHHLSLIGIEYGDALAILIGDISPPSLGAERYAEEQNRRNEPGGMRR